MKQYLNLIRHVLATGTRKENRTGVDTISTFNYNYEIDLREGFPLLTTKQVSWKNIVVEMLWFLSGQTDISILKRHGCKFWDAWADPETGNVPSAYGNFWRQFPIHAVKSVCSGCGQFVFGPHGCPGPDLNATASKEPVMEPGFNDQISWVLAELKRNPMSRRMVVSAWAPGNAQTSKLPPCHCLFMFNVQNDEKDFEKLWEAVNSSYQDTQVLGVVWASTAERAYEQALHKYGPQLERMPYGEFIDCLHVREPIQSRYEEYMWSRSNPKQRLCLHLTQRSADVALGIPFNIASYALLLSLFSHFTGIEPGIFAHTLVDAHIYTAKPDGSKSEYDHIPGLMEELTRTPKALPKLRISDKIKNLEDIETLMAPTVSTEEVMSHFVLEGYEPHPAIKFKVAV